MLLRSKNQKHPLHHVEVNTKMQSKTEKIREAVKRFPYLIPLYIKDKSFDPKITYGIMKKMLPLRFSIEIECLGALNKGDRTQDLNKLYNVYSLTRDYSYVRTEEDYLNATVLNEHRISVLGFKQLVGFYNVLEAMKHSLFYCKGGGIHIHIDLTPFYYSDNNSNSWKVESYYIKLHNVLSTNAYLDRVYKIFGSKYTGTYNRRSCEIDSKGNWINIRPYFKTIEFRIGDLTFEYEELIDIVIQLQALVKEINYKINNKNKITKGYDITKYHPLDRKSRKM